MKHVDLTHEELLVAGIVGVMRQADALKRQRPSAHGYDEKDPWTKHVEGAAAEMAVAKVTNRYWSPLKAGALYGGPVDVGRMIQVRQTKRGDGCLLLHRSDADDHVFVLVIGSPPSFDVVGWIKAKDGKRPEFWRTFTGRPAFFVPQEALRPV